MVVKRERKPCGCAGERERMVYLRGERFDWSSEQECVGMRVAGERERERESAGASIDHVHVGT